MCRFIREGLLMLLCSFLVTGSTFCKLGRTYAPVSTAKFVREGFVAKDQLSSVAKKLRDFHYCEERRLLKTFHKVPDPRPTKPVHPTMVIQKKPVLHAKGNNEWAELLPPKPKRVRMRKRPAPQEESSTNINTPTEPVGETEKQESVKVASAANVTVTESKKADNKPTAESNQNALRELDNTMSSILKDELKQIMVKVRQELPDDVSTEAEELVVNKFRNEAGDDLYNAMGLNVTSRLLNVHNALYAKLQFSGKPEPGCLQAFIRKHRITAFKRIADSTRDVFAARFDCLADFDRLCVHSEVKCGSATVTIIPCYKYFSKPPTLRSIYFDNITKRRDQTPIDNEQEPDADKTTKSVENTEVKSDNAKAAVKTNTETTSVAKQPNTTPTKTTTTPNPKMPEKAVAVKALPQEKPKQTVQETLKPVVKETPKVVPVVTKVSAKVEDKDSDVKNDKQVKLDSIDDMMVVDEEIGEEEGDEEMTDQDILALMSGGIVLDECSGSDEEK